MDTALAKKTLEFDHQVLRPWRKHVPKNSAVILAVSGGVDSMVMADFLVRWQRLLKLELVIAHVHHGKIAGAQGRFRDQAAKRVQVFAQQHQVPLWSNFVVQNKKIKVDGPAVRLKSEAQFRDFRWKLLRKWQSQWQSTYDRQVFIATAHTVDDQLETQLLRLLRGTGPDGLKAMALRDGDILRPLLEQTKENLIRVAKKRHLKWSEDPSNKKHDALRNWVRLVWLKPLKKRWPEAAQNIARSLARLGQSGEAVLELPVRVNENGVSRQDLMGLPVHSQRQVLVQYFRSLGLTDYTQGHVDEILRRLDTGRRDLTFELLGHKCVVSESWIALRPD